MGNLFSALLQKERKKRKNIILANPVFQPTTGGNFEGSSKNSVSSTKIHGSNVLWNELAVCVHFDPIMYHAYCD